MTIPTLLRLAEHNALSNITLQGSVLDLGGDARAEYRRLIQGNPTYTIVNLDSNTTPDIFHDLEQKLPVTDSSYDHALLMNVLEHIYNHRQLLSEAFRAVRPGGSVVVVVPFLFPVHPSPDDFWRFSASSLKKEVDSVGGTMVSFTPLGSGVFASRYVMLDRLMPGVLRLLAFYTCRPIVLLMDALFTRIAQALGKKYDPADYALGYVVHATKATGTA